MLCASLLVSVFAPFIQRYHIDREGGNLSLCHAVEDLAKDSSLLEHTQTSAAVVLDIPPVNARGEPKVFTREAGGVFYEKQLCVEHTPSNHHNVIDAECLGAHKDPGDEEICPRRRYEIR
ncbi:hypothetical protein MRX96_023481 [Rhipicephalus microplus]